MTISAALASELKLLTQALDRPGIDLAETLFNLDVDAKTAVDSYLGLRLSITASRTPLDMTVLAEGTQPAHIRTSLLVPLAMSTVDGIQAPASVELILYAATPGGFIDLAADLAWVTGRALADLRLDEHLAFPSNFANSTPLKATSAVNQALGVLIGRGSTPEQAEHDLDARAVAAHTGLVAAADLILAEPMLPPSKT